MNKNTFMLQKLLSHAKNGEKVCIATTDGIFDITYRKEKPSKSYVAVYLDEAVWEQLEPKKQEEKNENTY